ncbi:MAG: trypsin-like serine protease [Myxococcota bacterium]
MPSLDTGIPDAGVPDTSGPRPAECDDTDFPTGVARTGNGLVNGTTAPSVVALTPGQIQALVSVWSDTGFCSGIVVGPGSVLTAAHCTIESNLSVRFGRDALQPSARRDVISIAVHPELDLAMLRLAEDALSDLDVTPIALGRHSIGLDDIGTLVEVAGFGLSVERDGLLGFLASPLVRVGAETVDVDGGGRQGLCFGDSGGPILMVDPNEEDVRVMGVLSEGDLDCIGEDRYALVEPGLAFLERVGAPLAGSGPPVCGRITERGGCSSTGNALACTGDGLSESICPVTCGFNGEGYGCIDAPSDCGDVPSTGRCSANTLSWCEEGVVRQRQCDACGETCRFVPEGDTYACVFEACGDLGSSGRCAGDTVVEYCDVSNRFRQFDCASIGQRCAVEAGRARCVVPPGTCARLGGRGECQGDLRIFCQGADFGWDNCAAFGARCLAGECVP